MLRQHMIANKDSRVLCQVSVIESVWLLPALPLPNTQWYIQEMHFLQNRKNGTTDTGIDK